MPIISSGSTVGGAGSLLAFKQATTGNNASTTSASLGDVDASNAALTFVAPSSGIVLFVASFACNISTNAQGQIGLRESTTNIFGPFAVVVGNATANDTFVVTVPMRLTGIAAGSHTYKLAFAATAGATMTIQNVGSAATNYPIMLAVYVGL